MLILLLGGFSNPAFSYLFLLPAGFAFTEELLLNSVFAGWGLGLAFLGLILFPLLGVFIGGRSGDARVVFEVYGLLFATRVVLSPFPIHMLESPSALPSIYTLIMATCIFYLWFRRIPLGSTGFSRGKPKILKQVLAGILVGGILGFIEYLILKPKPILAEINLQNIIFLTITMIVFVGLTEELLFRGLLQTHLAKLMSKWQAVHLTSLIFAIFHFGWLNPLEVFFAYTAGIIFGYMLIKTVSLTSPVLAHGFGNIVLYLIAQTLT